MASRRWRLTLAVGVVAFVNLCGIVTAQRGDPRRGEVQAQEQGGPAGAGVTIYAEPNFRGPNANVHGDLADLRQVNMNDRVASLRIGRGEVWEVCENANYRGRCRLFSDDDANLDRVNWGGMISSMRRLRSGEGRGFLPPASQMRSRLVIFDDTAFRGRSVAITNQTPTVRLPGDRARSVKVYGGAWELCDRDRFRGRCVTVTDKVPDLGRVGLRDTVASAHPVGRNR